MGEKELPGQKNVAADYTNPRYVHDRIVLFYQMTMPNDSAEYEEYEKLAPQQQRFHELLAQDIAMSWGDSLAQLLAAENDIEVLREFGHDLLKTLHHNDVRGIDADSEAFRVICENIHARRTAWAKRVGIIGEKHV